MNKDWRTNVGDRVIRENLWGEANKQMHGLQVAAFYQPCFKFGLGLHTGLAFEDYMSTSDAVKAYDAESFEEYALYLPLHVMYRIPFTRNASLSVYGGLGINWAMYGTYTREEHRKAGAVLAILTGEDIYFERTMAYQQYGKGEWPKHWNLQWEIGGQLRINRVVVGFTYSFGASNHHFYPGYLTRQDKINITLGVATRE